MLSFILNRDGQQDVAHEGDYLPLTAEVARAQLKLLEPAASPVGG